VSKVRSNTLGAYMLLQNIRSSNALEIVWFLRVVKTGSKFELAPIRPAVCLRKPLHLEANSVKRLM
jgi:hypothetical protein